MRTSERRNAGHDRLHCDADQRSARYSAEAGSGASVYIARCRQCRGFVGRSGGLRAAEWEANRLHSGDQAAGCLDAHGREEVRQNLERFQSLIPEDIKITYEFDQSQYVRDALLSVLREGLIGALA